MQRIQWEWDDKKNVSKTKEKPRKKTKNQENKYTRKRKLDKEKEQTRKMKNRKSENILDEILKRCGEKWMETLLKTLNSERRKNSDSLGCWTTFYSKLIGFFSGYLSTL